MLLGAEHVRLQMQIMAATDSYIPTHEVSVRAATHTASLSLYFDNNQEVASYQQ